MDELSPALACDVLLSDTQLRLIPMTITRTFDYLKNLKENFPKSDMLAVSKGGTWTKYSVDDYIKASYETAYGLLAHGYQPEDKIISITNNRPEWNFLDMGCTLARLIYVPIYPTLSGHDFEYIFNHSDAKAVFVGSNALYKKVKAHIEAADHHIDVFLIDGSVVMPCMSELRLEGRKNADTYRPIVEKNIETVSPDDVATIIYTSGTTGLPKGVMLTHRNLTFDAHSHAIRQVYNQKHKMVSFLPLCHCYERTMNYEYQELGISIYYAESIATIQRDLASCHADGFCAVPRVLETFYDKFHNQESKLKGLAKKIYHKAWVFGNEYNNYDTRLLYRLRLALFDKLVYRKWRAAIGGHRMIIVSGGSSIAPHIVKLFNAAKLYIFEGYGMTETSPVIAVNNPCDGINKLGTAGLPIEGAELKIADDGEIMVRGPHVMKGYYKDPAETARVIEPDGWLHTGDIGSLLEGRFLRITDRKKEIFKLSSGKYIAPQVIEKKLSSIPFFSNAFVVGENEKFASAIIVVNYEAVRQWLKEQGKDEIGRAELLADTGVVRMLNAEVAAVNKTLADYEAVKRPVYVLDEWSVSNELLSQTLKPKRANLRRRYAEQIERIYALKD